MKPRPRRHWAGPVATTWRPDGRLAVKATGPDVNAKLTGTARHPLGRLPDVNLTFASQGNGTFLSRQKVPEGRWTLRLEMQDGDKLWRREEVVQ